MQQISISFEPKIHDNTERLSGQNKRLLEWLQAGNTIHCFHPIKFKLQIGYLNSRISDLIKAGVELHKRRISVSDINGDPVSVVEYSLRPFT